jgi:hypothetical protein
MLYGFIGIYNILKIIIEYTKGRMNDSTAHGRLKAVLAIAPWGMQDGFWDATGLAGVRVPTFLVMGSEDHVSGSTSPGR